MFHSVLCTLTAATAEQAHGSVAFIPENEELAAEETVEILYTPPEGLFASVDSLLYCGGFNGWDGEEEAMTLPMMPVDDGRFRVSINVPNFARVRFRCWCAILTVGSYSAGRLSCVYSYEHGNLICGGHPNPRYVTRCSVLSKRLWDRVS